MRQELPEGFPQVQGQGHQTNPLDVQIAYYEAIKAAAESAGEPVNNYIKRAIQERMDKEDHKVGE